MEEGRRAATNSHTILFYFLVGVELPRALRLRSAQQHLNFVLNVWRWWTSKGNPW